MTSRADAPPSPAGFFAGLALVAGLGAAAWWVNGLVAPLTLPGGIPGKALEYPLWAVLMGLTGNAALQAAGRAAWVRPGVRTELFLKIGLVLLGSGLSLSTLTAAAGGALVQGVVMISAVFGFCWWLAGRFGLEDKLRAVMATAVSVCGVSAAIAAAGAVVARKEQVTYVTSLVIVTALPLMVLAPLAAQAMGLPPAVAGAWFGGNIDTTAAVVGAGTLYGEAAQKVASVVKATQNALIGVVTFLLALYFATVVERRPAERPSARLLWDRFPKFILGFVAASVLYTLGVVDGGKGTTLEALKNWAFTFAFVGLGLELSWGELRRMGWAPLAVFLLTTLFNTALALLMAWLIFGQLAAG